MYVRPHLDYGDVIYHDQIKESMQLLESVQYQAALIVTGCWKGSSRTKVYQDLGWESLSERRHFRRLSIFYQIKHDLAPKYLAERVRDTPADITKRYANYFFLTAMLTGTKLMHLFRMHQLFHNSRAHSWKKSDLFQNHISMSLTKLGFVAYPNFVLDLVICAITAKIITL